MNDNTYSIEELERRARSNFSSYEGTEPEFYEAYTGAGDPFLDFGGAPLSFEEEIKSGKHFSIEITNSHPTDTLSCFLFGGDLYAPGQAGTIRTGQFASIDGATGLSCSGDPYPVERLLKWVNRNPTRIAGLKIQSTTPSQMEKTFVIEKWSPFRQLPNQFIRISNFKDESDFNDKVATIREPFQVDDQTLVRLAIPVGTTNITFYFGASMNVASALNQKATVAKANVSRYGFHRLRSLPNSPTV